ncbi:hypothetical protein [Streptomyces sp. NPDC056491]|uniref:hypothetical protein n=1 Tax=Streptomyces sp. NPDC056491 TaxID=3345837 RepID=UPI0036CA7FF4
MHHNTADDFGGGIRNLFGALRLDRSTVRNNTAGTTSGGIANLLGTVTLSSSTVRDNNPNNCFDVPGCSG